jgi:AraC-like DNA-binding protein
VKNYRPLLLQELNVRLPGLTLRRLRLNRHLPEVDSLSEHSHNFVQILCYLSGRGAMRVAGEEREIRPLTVALLPPRTEHAFRETVGRRPLCLVLDLDLRGATKHGFRVAGLVLADAAAIRRELSTLIRLRDPNDSACRLMVASAALRVADVFLRTLSVLPPRQNHVPPFVRDFDRLLRRPESAEASIADLAQRLGYQTDYLNRIFKQSTGQTLGEYRNAQQVERAKRLLRENGLVKDVGEAMGFVDQNYFSRWFKKHTGMQPRAFRFAAS